VLEEAIAGSQDTDTVEHLRHLLKTKVYSSAGLTGVFNFVVADIVDATFEETMNVSNPDVLPIAGGKLVDLRTREVRDRVKTDLFSFELNVSYLGDNHPCPEAERFFGQVFIHNAELIEFAQRLFGYSMTGHVSEKG
jgi:phage/plasmid-associated DNA primase